jgi:hypothetical protein
MMPACDRTPGNLSMRVRDNEIDEAPGVQVSEQLERLVNSASIRSGYASLLGHVAIAILLAVLTIRPTTSKQLRPLILGFNPEPSGMAATFEAAPQPHPAASSRESSLPSSETVSEPADPDTAFPLHPSDATPAEASPQAPEDTAEVLADSSAGEPEPVAIVSTSSSDGEVKSGLAMRRAAATPAAGQSLRHPRSVGLHGGAWNGLPLIKVLMVAGGVTWPTRDAVGPAETRDQRPVPSAQRPWHCFPFSGPAAPISMAPTRKRSPEASTS